MNRVTKVMQISVLFHAGKHFLALALGWKDLLLRTAKGCLSNAVNSGDCGTGDAVPRVSSSSAPSTSVSGGYCHCQRSLSHQGEQDP